MSEKERRRRSVAWSESDPVQKSAFPQRDAGGGIAVGGGENFTLSK